MEINHREVAAQILAIIGGKGNVVSATHCMTRLRLVLKHDEAKMHEKLGYVNGVLGVHASESELQIILGPSRVDAVFAELEKLLQAEAGKSAPAIGDGKELRAQIKAKNATPVKLFLKKIATIFLPLLPGLIACGLITGLLNVILKIDPSLAALPAVKILAILGNAVFLGLNIFVGMNAAKVYGGSPVLGGVLAAVISHPLLANITLWESSLVPGRGGIIAVLAIAILGAQLEKRLHKATPEVLDLFLTPLLVLLIVGFAAILILQPIGGFIAEFIGYAANTAIASGGPVAGFILGGLWLPIVMTGIHQALTPIHAQLISFYGCTILLPALAMAGAGQVGASFAVYKKTKNSFLKKTVLSALPIGMLGVGEPLIYGVTLPLGKPFVGACIGGAFGGAVQAAFMVSAYSIGLSGIPLAAVTDNIPMYFVGLIVAYIAGFVATWLIGFDDPPEKE